MSLPRLRIAIEPGGCGLGFEAARDALFTWLLARKAAGSIVLRSDLTGPGEGEAERRVIDDLLWLGLGWDEGLDAVGEQGPYRRSERLGLYRSTAAELVRQGKAYRCACPDRFESAPRPACPCGGRAIVDAAAGDAAATERILLRMARAEDSIALILVQKDGLPGPEFASALDDALMGITHVVLRGDRPAATTRQKMVHAAIGKNGGPEFVQLPPVVHRPTSATSEIDSPSTVEQCRSEGYPPEAVLNLLAHLGAVTGVRQEVLTREEMLAAFDSGSTAGDLRPFDPRRLADLSLRHMARMPPERLASLAAEHLAAAGLLSRPSSVGECAWAGAVARLYVERLARMCTLPRLAELFFRFDPGECLADDLVRRVLHEPSSRRVIEALLKIWSETPAGEEMTAERFQSLIPAVRRATGVKGKPLYDALRIALTGRAEGPDLARLVSLIERGKRLHLPRPVIGCAERARSLLEATVGDR